MVSAAAAGLFALGMISALTAAAFLDGNARVAFLVIAVAEGLAVPLLCCDDGTGPEPHQVMPRQALR
jgi:hypothetical protein